MIEQCLFICVVIFQHLGDTIQCESVYEKYT